VVRELDTTTAFPKLTKKGAGDSAKATFKAFFTNRK